MYIFLEPDILGISWWCLDLPQTISWNFWSSKFFFSTYSIEDQFNETHERAEAYPFYQDARSRAPIGATYWGKWVSICFRQTDFWRYANRLRANHNLWVIPGLKCQWFSDELNSSTLRARRGRSLRGILSCHCSISATFGVKMMSGTEPRLYNNLPI